jgi:hypothetical protein
MSLNPNMMDNPTVMQLNAFGRIDGDTNFPYISVFRTRYPDQSTAYNNASALPISAFDVQIFPKYAMLVYNIAQNYSQGTTLTAGNPAFKSTSIQIYNPSTVTHVDFTLTSGLCCQIFAPAGVTTINLSVSGVDAYNGCTVTFLG